MTLLCGLLSSCETTKESANKSDTVVKTKNPGIIESTGSVDGYAWYSRNPQFPGVPGPTIPIQSEEERRKVIMNKAGRR